MVSILELIHKQLLYCFFCLVIHYDLFQLFPIFHFCSAYFQFTKFSIILLCYFLASFFSRSFPMRMNNFSKVRNFGKVLIYSVAILVLSIFSKYNNLFLKRFISPATTSRFQSAPQFE